MKAMSYQKRVRLGDAAPDQHVIVLYQGKLEDIICPHRQAKKAAQK
jgi:flagellin-specific chaperone FliS